LPKRRQKSVLRDVEAATTTRERHPTETVKEELEQVFETAQAEEEEKNEHSEEWLNTFSQEAEKKEAVALKMTAEEEAEEQVDRLLTPWEMELEMLEDWLNNPGPAGELTGVELSEKVTEQAGQSREDCRDGLCSRVAS
jgi:hypothetical protein